jgi:glutathione peroxidase
MTTRQRILKWAYPLLVLYKKVRGKDKKLYKKDKNSPTVPFYTLSAQLNGNKELSFESLKGKKVMIVNTASDCGYTNQYAELQKLYQHSKDELIIVAFPSNDFKEQEKGSDSEIAEFCQRNYGVSFPLAKKTIVRRGLNQNKVFAWLTDQKLNGWNSQEPTWNFSKYIIDEEGNLTHYFDPAVSPLSPEILNAIRHSPA